MGLASNKKSFAFSLGGVALLAGCSGDVSLVDYDDTDYSAEEADADGVLIGTTWEALSYPVCMYAWSDPDRDGWGWEFNRSCIMPSTQTMTYPYCQSAFSDPDGDGWGWEFNRTCIVNRTSSSTPTTTTPTYPTTTTTYPTTTTTTTTTCANPEGTHSVMAALAVAAANELGRWQPVQDFAVGRMGAHEALVLSGTGKQRCGTCSNIQSLLDLQKEEATGKVYLPGNVLLSPAALRSRMVAKFRDQEGCERQPSNGGTTNCPAEQHKLIFQRSERGGCDTNYFFVAKKPDGSSLQYPQQLKNKLLWADRENPYVQFQSIGEVVSIDPTYGLNDLGTTSSGACSNSCVKIGITDVSGQCCSCNGKTRTLRRTSWSQYTYLCQ